MSHYDEQRLKWYNSFLSNEDKEVVKKRTHKGKPKPKPKPAVQAPPAQAAIQASKQPQIQPPATNVTRPQQRQPATKRRPPAVPPPRKRAAPPPIPGAPPKKRPISPPPGMSEEKTRALYKRYIAARKQVGKSTDVPYRELVKTLRKQAPTLMKQHKAKAVEFDVAVKNGRVVLKAKPKR